MSFGDSIFVEGLAVWARVGVTAQERAVEQRIELDIEMTPARPLRRLGDDLGKTADYAAVAEEAARIVRARPRALIETVAEDVAEGVLGRFSVARVAVTVRKFVLPNTRAVGVRLERIRGAAGEEGLEG